MALILCETFTGPYMGENGNWYINDVDTGVPATGAQGNLCVNSLSGLNQMKLLHRYRMNGNDAPTAYLLTFPSCWTV